MTETFSMNYEKIGIDYFAPKSTDSAAFTPEWTDHNDADPGATQTNSSDYKYLPVRRYFDEEEDGFDFVSETDSAEATKGLQTQIEVLAFGDPTPESKLEYELEHVRVTSLAISGSDLDDPIPALVEDWMG